MLRRFSVFSLAFLLCLSLFPSRAFAWDFLADGCFWRGNTSQGMYGVCVHADNQFDAAAWVIYGRDPSMLTSEVRTKLSDPNYGGRFYEYVQTFSHMDDLTQYPDWLPAYVGVANIFINGLAGDVNFYTSNVSESLYSGAKIDFGRVLAGEDLGGTSGGGNDVSGGIPSSVPLTTAVGRFYNTWNGWNGYVDAKSNFVVNIGNVSSLTSALSSRGASHIYFWVCPYMAIYGSGWAYRSRLYVFASADEVRFSISASSGNPSALSISASSTSTIYTYVWDYLDVSIPSPSPNPAYTISGRVTYGDYSFTNSGTSFSIPSSFVHSSRTYYLTQAASNGVGAYVPPSGTWPEPATPVTPTAPVLPEPSTPTVETPVSPTVPAPVWPDVTINIEPDPVPGTTPSGLDYTELLTRINDNLISIDAFARAINSNLNSLRSDLLAEFNGVIDSLRNVYNYLLTIDSVLETHCTHLRNKMEESAVFIANYMRTLIRWLADQLDYDDMTNVEAPDNSLLSTINEKLGGGTYEPNPIKDEQGYYQWLDDLWDRFLLGDNWQSSMGSISGSFSELKTRFPFSVPWDIVALFRLFVHDPVTPSFDLPLYFSPDGSTPVHVDLSPWDSVASLVRPMIFVIFALKLALLSRDLLGGLGADKGGL